MRFELPRKIDPVDREVDGQVQRQYNVEVREKFGVSVGFNDLPVELAAADLRRNAEQVVERLRQAGAEDIRLYGTRQFEVQGRPTFDGILAFTAATGDKSYWRMRYVLLDPDSLLVVQVVTFIPIGDAKTRHQADLAFMRTIDAIRLR